MNKYEAVLKEIPQHIVYFKQYEADRHLFFWNPRTGENALQDLSDQVMEENPRLRLTEPDYNYFLYPQGWFDGSRKKVVFCDQVTAAGQDTGSYAFRLVASVSAITVLHQGPFEGLFQAYQFAVDWIEKNQMKICGFPRDSFIHGFWDQDDPGNYLTEVQIPIKCK